jgi:hypothetical protein
MHHLMMQLKIEASDQRTLWWAGVVFTNGDGTGSMHIYHEARDRYDYILCVCWIGRR